MELQLRSMLKNYIALDFSLHWLRQKQKIPVDKAWNQKPVATLVELEQSYQPGMNLGVRAGKWSRVAPGCGLLILDVDLRSEDHAEECYAAVDRLLGDASRFPCVASGRGLGGHYYMACPLDDLPPVANTTLAESYDGEKKLWAIELLSTGKQVVLPPSVHPETGKRYTWPKIPRGGFPRVPNTVLTEASKQKTKTAHTVREGKRNDHLFKYGCGLQRNGTPDNEIVQALIARNVEYCQPPLPEGEVLQIIESVLSYPKGQPSQGENSLITNVLTDPTVLREQSTRQEVAALLRDPGERLKLIPLLRKQGYTVQAIADAIQEYEEAEYYITPQRVNVSDLVQQIEQPYWAVKDLIPGSGFSLLVAPPKLGKSTTARYLAWCIATGERFLGMEIPTPGPVLWVTGDETLQEVALGFNRIYTSCGDPGTIEVMQGYIRKDEYLNTLEAAIVSMEPRPELVVIDTFAHAFDLEDVNNYGQVERVLSLFKARMERLGTPVLFLFHTNKHGAQGNLTSILGSTAIRGASSANIALHEKAGGILLNAEIRLARGIKDLHLEIDWKTGVVHTSDAHAGDEDVKAVEQAAAVAQVVRSYRESTGEWPTKTQVRDRLSVRGDRKTEYINTALELGWVASLSQGRKEILYLPEDELRIGEIMYPQGRA